MKPNIFFVFSFVFCRNLLEMSVKLSILIPAYNEARTIHLILDKVKDVVLANNIIKEIIIVDDFSSDNTIVKIKEYQSENPAINISLFTHGEQTQIIKMY